MKISIAKAREVVKGWSEQQKDRVRRDCQIFADLTAANSPVETVRVSAPFAYIVAKCFDKRMGDISHTEIAALLD